MDLTLEMPGENARKTSQLSCLLTLNSPTGEIQTSSKSPRLLGSLCCADFLAFRSSDGSVCPCWFHLRRLYFGLSSLAMNSSSQGGAKANGYQTRTQSRMVL